jgi:hypothetical protein
LYFSDRPREIETAAKVNIVCLEIKEGMFLRTTYEHHLNVSAFNPRELPDGNFYFLIHYMDQFSTDIILKYRFPENQPMTNILLKDPTTWGLNIEADSYIPEQIVQLIIEKRVKILCHNDHVNVDDRFTHQWIQWLCQRYPGVGPDDFVFLVPCAGDSKFHTIDNTPWSAEIVRKLSEVPDLFNRAHTAITSQSLRKNKFISLNGRPTEHRQVAVTYLFDYRHEGILTFSENLERTGFGGKTEVALNPDKSFAKRYREIQENFPLTWDFRDQEDYGHAANLFMSSEYIDENLSTYLNIITETRFHNTSPVWFSEKTFRAMMFLQPFVVLGAAGSLQALRNCGYRTFGQWIDESYDDIDDDIARATKAIASAVEFFNNRSQAELSAVLLEMLPVLEHNYYHLIAYTNRSTASIVNRLANTIHSNNKTNLACNFLVYDSSKTQHGITNIPYALLSFSEALNAVSYSDIVPLPETFYFQLDRGLMDMAWITAQKLKFYNIDNFYNSIADIPVTVKQAVLAHRAKFIIYDWGNLKSIDDFELLVDTLVHRLQQEGGNFTYNDFVIVSNIGWQSSRLTFISFNFWEAYYTEKFNKDNPGLTVEIVKGISKKQRRKNKFICLNGRYSNSRLATVTLLSDLKDQGILTLIDAPQPLLVPPGEMVTAIANFGNFTPELAHQFGKKIKDQLPWHWAVDLTVDYSSVSWTKSYETQRLWSTDSKYVASALDCYLNIVTETNYEYNGMVRHTEKIFKAINLMQPFIVVGEPGQLSSLQTQGYKTFGQWIDESYDTISDSRVRIFAAAEAAREFISQDTDKLAEIMLEMLPVLIHNKKLAQYRQRTVWSRLEIDLARALMK